MLHFKMTRGFLEQVEKSAVSKLKSATHLPVARQIGSVQYSGGGCDSIWAFRQLQQALAKALEKGENSAKVVISKKGPDSFERVVTVQLEPGAKPPGFLGRTWNLVKYAFRAATFSLKKNMAEHGTASLEQLKLDKSAYKALQKFTQEPKFMQAIQEMMSSGLITLDNRGTLLFKQSPDFSRLKNQKTRQTCEHAFSLLQSISHQGENALAALPKDERKGFGKLIEKISLLQRAMEKGAESGLAPQKIKFSDEFVVKVTKTGLEFNDEVYQFAKPDDMTALRGKMEKVMMPNLLTNYMQLAEHLVEGKHGRYVSKLEKIAAD